MYNEQPGTGAIESKKDPRTIQHADLVGEPLIKGGVTYSSSEIEHQHRVGICTAISLIQNRQKANGKKYSPDFQYLLQKKLYDLNWQEGSSILNALRVGKNIGFLPAESWVHTTEADRYLPYNEYVAKLTAISSTEVERLKSLCVDKISGYALVNVGDPQSIAKAIAESEAGILCRYGCQSNWWTPSWLTKDIDPLRNAPETSGHAIIMQNFDYTTGSMQMLANTWGTQWDIQGTAHINWNNYPMSEAWTILRENPMFKFTKTMKLGTRDPEVKELQKRLLVMQTGYFGILTYRAVKSYQQEKGLTPDGIVGKLTRDCLNQ